MRSESALRRQFAENKAVLVAIGEMQTLDAKLVRIAPTFTRLESDWSWPRKNVGISAERWNRYRALFRQAGITDGIQKDGDALFYFVSSIGLSVNGATRGFVHTEHAPGRTVEQFEACPRGTTVCYIPLEKDWYLFQWNE